MAELREGARANSLLLAAAVLMLAGGWVALTREGAEVAGRLVLAGVQPQRPDRLGAPGDAVRARVRARDRPGRRVLRRDRRRVRRQRAAAALRRSPWPSRRRSWAPGR